MYSWVRTSTCWQVAGVISGLHHAFDSLQHSIWILSYQRLHPNIATETQMNKSPLVVLPLFLISQVPMQIFPLVSAINDQIRSCLLFLSQLVIIRDFSTGADHNLCNWMCCKCFTIWAEDQATFFGGCFQSPIFSVLRPFSAQGKCSTMKHICKQRVRANWDLLAFTYPFIKLNGVLPEGAILFIVWIEILDYQS